MSKVRLRANELAAVSGTTFTRWGHRSCPQKSMLIYSGRAAGTYYNHKHGGSATYICLPDDPEYHPTNTQQPTHAWMSEIAGVEYDGVTVNARFDNFNNVPCSVCNTESRTALLMSPAKLRCPDSSWTLEYRGFLMTASSQPPDTSTRGRTEYVCVDESTGVIPGMGDNQNGALLTKTYVKCTGPGTIGYCPPYDAKKTIACTVCTK